jgi:hypothetical protein
VHQVQVGVTGAGTAHAEEHLTGPRFPLLDVVELGRLPELDKLQCTHVPMLNERRP